jgi:sporulation protein YlmC with PRC-barrel domain
VIVPLSAIAMTTAKVGTASIDVSTRQWKKAPEFRKQDVVLLAEPERAQSIGRFYQRADGFLRSAQDSETRPALTSTGRKAGRPPPSQQKTELLMASDIVGKEVINREQKKLGEVMDLLINFSEKKPALALVLVIARQGSEAANSFAVPVRLLNPAQNGNLQINADRESFEHAQPFSFEERSGLERGQNEIYRWDGR